MPRADYSSAAGKRSATTAMLLATLSLTPHLQAQESCFGELNIRTKGDKVQLTWTAVPSAVTYEVVRSDEANPSDFLGIAVIPGLDETFLDFPPASNVTYLYRLIADTAAGSCDSGVVAAHPPQLRRRGINTNPVIFTEPVDEAAQGRPYVYATGAADAESDALSFDLTESPSSMVIDPSSGLIQWLPPLPGLVPVQVVVLDGRGGQDVQEFIVDVAPSDLEGTVAVIGPEGGSVIDPAGVIVSVPAGALSTEQLIAAQTLATVDRLPGQFPSPITPFLGGASLGPDGMVFEEAVTVTVPLVAPYPEGTLLPVVVWDDTRDLWEESTMPAVVNADGISADFRTLHFSTFVVAFSELDSAPFFGGIDAFSQTDLLLQQVRNRFVILFGLGDSRLLNPGPSPLEGQQGFDFFNCYQGVGAFFLVDLVEATAGQPLVAQTSVGCEDAEACDADLVFAFGRPVDETFLANGAQVSVVGRVEATLFFRSTPPDVFLEPDADGLWVSQQIPLEARVECGGEGMRDQDVQLEISEGADLGATAPESATTSVIGAVDATFTANVSLGGTATVTLTYPWESSTRERQLDLIAESDIDVYSLTGNWFGSGTGEDFDCEDPDDNGSGPGSGTGSITQTALGIVGGGGGLTFGGTVTPGDGDAFSVGGGWSEEGSGTWSGSGTIGGGSISVEFEGSDSECKTRGSGTLTRLD